MSDTMTTIYNPSEEEPYMNENQQEYFKHKLMVQKKKLLSGITLRKEKIKTLKFADADIIDRSSSWMDIEAEISVFERHCSLIREIDNALGRIESGHFGYCEITGNEIGLRRLEAMPSATFSIEALQSIEN